MFWQWRDEANWPRLRREQVIASTTKATSTTLLASVFMAIFMSFLNRTQLRLAHIHLTGASTPILADCCGFVSLAISDNPIKNIGSGGSRHRKADCNRERRNRKRHRCGLCKRAGALLVDTDAFLFSRRDQLIDLATRYKISTIFDRRKFAEIGG